MQKPFKNSSEADLRTAWKWVLGICVAYGAILTVFVGLMLYELTVDGTASDTAQAEAVHPVQSRPAHFAAEKVD